MTKYNLGNSLLTKWLKVLEVVNHSSDGNVSEYFMELTLQLFNKKMPFLLITLKREKANPLEKSLIDASVTGKKLFNPHLKETITNDLSEYLRSLQD